MKPDPDAYRRFLDLLHAHQGIVGKVCAVYGHGSDERDDLRQEILLQAWRSFSTFRGEAAFSSWLCRVALNTALLHRRRKSRRREAPLDGNAVADLAAASTAEVTPDVERLQRCVRELPRLDRALVLLALERHDHGEIAAITGLGRKNVGVRLVRIRVRLRR